MVVYVHKDTLSVMPLKIIGTNRITTFKENVEKLIVPLKSTLVAYVRKDTLSAMPLKMIERKNITTFKDYFEKNESPFNFYFDCLCVHRHFNCNAL